MVYIKSLNKNLFPLYLPPKEDELFSSWLCRMAINHNLKPQSFTTNYFGREMPIWNRDIDLSPPIKLLDSIEQHTPLTTRSVRRLFLIDFESYVFESKGFMGGYTLNVMPLGIKHRKRKRHGMSFCPNCLNDNVFYQKHWRLTTSIICVKCNTYLLDRCPSCESQITFHRINVSNNASSMEFKPLNTCSNCDYILSNHRSKRKPSLLEIEYQIYINNTIKNGCNSMTQYSFNYIKTLLLLSNKSRSTSKINRFRRALAKTDNFNLSTINNDIRFWKISERIETLPEIYALLKNKKQTKLMFKSNNVTKSYIDPDNILPYWFVKQFYF